MEFRPCTDGHFSRRGPSRRSLGAPRRLDPSLMADRRERPPRCRFWREAPGSVLATLACATVGVVVTSRGSRGAFSRSERDGAAPLLERARSHAMALMAEERVRLATRGDASARAHFPSIRRRSRHGRDGVSHPVVRVLRDGLAAIGSPRRFQSPLQTLDARDTRSTSRAARSCRPNSR